MDFWELFCISLGAAVAVYYCVKLFLFSALLFPKVWFPLPKSFFTSMGEWAVVTGGSEGIGRAYAFALAQRGMNVVIISRTQANLDQVAKEIGDSTGRAVKVIVADFTKDVFGQMEEKLKDLNVGVLVNNVGMLLTPLPTKFLDSANLDQNITKIIKLNVMTMVKMSKIILPGMDKRGKGVIINIASGVASVPFPLYTLYSASKVFVERFSQGLQTEYKSRGIIIQSVSPFGVSTRMTRYQKTSAVMLDAADFVDTSLQYLRAGDKTYGSICHTFVGWLLQTIPGWILYSEWMQQKFQGHVKKAPMLQNGSRRTQEIH